MAVTGYLAEFSLPELFQFLDQGHKTGLLTINGLSVDRNRNSQSHYIWVHEGRIVAAAASLDQKGLLSMIAQRGWLSDRVVSRLAQVFSNKTPMGLCLKSHGLLEAEQLKVLFKSQVLRRVCALFQLQDGQFEFQTKVPLPLAEMTGLSVPATEATLMSLRALRDWTALKDKLPAPYFWLDKRNYRATALPARCPRVASVGVCQRDCFPGSDRAATPATCGESAASCLPLERPQLSRRSATDCPISRTAKG
jgi:hypothetical protein